MHPQHFATDWQLGLRFNKTASQCRVAEQTVRCHSFS